MKIRRIAKLRGHRVFRAFEWPAALPAFDRLNVIYGWNGSGKSTLASIFRSIEKRSPIHEGDVTIEVDDASILASAFDTASGLPRTKVFNREFVDENVFSTTGTISPILFLGKESKEKQEEVQRLRKAIDGSGGIAVELIKAKNDITAADRDLDSYCVSQGSRIRELLRSAGSNPYNNYDKGSYKRTAERLLTEGLAAAKAKCLDESQLDELKAKKDSTPKPSLTEFTIPFPDIASKTEEVTAILRTTVVSATLKELEANAELEVKSDPCCKFDDGMRLIRTRSSAA